MQFSLFGFGVLLFLVFLVLQLCGVICWPWFLVTSPLWISAAIVIMVTIMLAIAFKFFY